MGELGTNDLWGSRTGDSPSQYARMIPGVSAIPLSRRKQKTPESAAGVAPASEKPAPRVQAGRLTQLLLPNPIAERFGLYRLVVADLIVLAAVCSLQTLLLPAWSLPRIDLPIFAVLVTLFGFSEGIYRPHSDPFPAGMVSGLARSVLFAITLLFVGARDGTHLRAIPAIFVSGLTALLLYRQLLRYVWARRRQHAECRKILIVGGGPCRPCHRPSAAQRSISTERSSRGSWMTICHSLRPCWDESQTWIGSRAPSSSMR